MKATSVTDVILGEAAHGTREQRFSDMLAIASVIANRAAATGTTPRDVVSVQSEFNAYGKSLPPGAQAYASLAEKAWQQVQQTGPIHNAMFFATPRASGNLPRGLQEVARTSGHVFFEDPQARSIRTAEGFRNVNVNAVGQNAMAARAANVGPIPDPDRGLGAQPPGGLYRNPMSIYGARVTSEFGPRSSPMGLGSANHRGMDMTAQHGRGQVGVPIQAIASGVVEIAGRSGGFGNMVQVRHDDGYTSRYAHLEAIPEGLARDSRVQAGQPIGTLGNTGTSTAPHLHLEVIDPNGRAVNPRDYVDLAMQQPPIPESNPNRAPQIAATPNPHEGLLSFTSSAKAAPGGLGNQGVTVAETPQEIAAAEAAIIDPAFDVGGLGSNSLIASAMASPQATGTPSMPANSSSMADSRIAAAFNASNPFSEHGVATGLAAAANAAEHAERSGTLGPVAGLGAGTFIGGDNIRGGSVQQNPSWSGTLGTPIAPDVMAQMQQTEQAMANAAAPVQVASTTPLQQAQQEAASRRGEQQTQQQVQEITDRPAQRTAAPPLAAAREITDRPVAEVTQAPLQAPPVGSGLGAIQSLFSSPAGTQANSLSHPGVTFTSRGDGTVARDWGNGRVDTVNAGDFNARTISAPQQGSMFGNMNLGERAAAAAMGFGVGGLPGAAIGGLFGPQLSQMAQGLGQQLGLGSVGGHSSRTGGLGSFFGGGGSSFPSAPAVPQGGFSSPSGSNLSYSDMAAISPAAAAAVASGRGGLF